MTLSAPMSTEYPSRNGPPEMAHAPIAVAHLGSGICSYRRVIRSAILVETVPETIMTSACLGEAAKKPAPKRSRSLWAMPVDIISMAQHAKPNCSGQSEFLRAQLKSLSVLVVLGLRARAPARRDQTRKHERRRDETRYQQHEDAHVQVHHPVGSLLLQQS